MTWTIADSAGLLLLAMAVASTWCVGRGQLIGKRRKKEQGQ
ncbi:hypothetical protein ACK3BK_15855 [Pseudomonas sp. L7]